MPAPSSSPPPIDGSAGTPSLRTLGTGSNQAAPGNLNTGTNTGDVTLGTANGLSLTGQTLSLATATDSTPGAMSAADKTNLDAATNVNTNSTIVKRDGSGNFSAGTITATLSGTATNFSGSLSGDVTGTQGSTVLSNVPGSVTASSTTGTTITSGIATSSSNTAFTLDTTNAISGSLLKIKHQGSTKWAFGASDITFPDATTQSTAAANGTGTNTFVTYWTGSKSLGSDAGFTFDPNQYGSGLNHIHLGNSGTSSGSYALSEVVSVFQQQQNNPGLVIGLKNGISSPTSLGSPMLQLGNQQFGGASSVALIGFGNVGNGVVNPPSAFGYVTTTTTGTQKGDLIWAVRSSATLDVAPTEAMRLVSAGRFLVGTSSDNGTDLLQVNGTIKSLSGGYVFPDGTTQTTAASGSTITFTAVGSSPNGDGGSASGSTITLEPADGTNPGVLTAVAQTIGGDKTFSGNISAANLSGTNTGDLSLATVGSSPNSSGASLSGQVLTLQPADGSNPGLLTAAGYTNLSNQSGTNTGDLTLSGGLGANNGLSLSGQVLSMALANGTSSGAMSAGAYLLFNGATAAATAVTLAKRDGNANVAVNNLATGFASTVTAAGTTTLAVASAAIQEFTGTTTQNVVLPDATTLLQAGFGFRIVNRSTGVVTVKDNSGSTVLAVPAGADIRFTCTDISTSAGVWDAAGLWAPTPTTLGGVNSHASVSHQFLTAIGTDGSVTGAQPSFSDLSGSATSAQLPNPTTSAIGGVQAINAVSHQWINSINTSGVPQLSQPAFSDISGSVSAGQLPNPGASSLGGVQSFAAVSHQFLTQISTSGVVSAAQPASADISDAASAATASVLMLRDANANTRLNALIRGFNTTATSGGTLTLSVSSAQVQQLTGSSNHTVKLPDATTLVVGQSFIVKNASTGTITVNANNSTLILSVPAGQEGEFTVTNVGTSAGTWDARSAITATGLGGTGVANQVAWFSASTTLTSNYTFAFFPNGNATNRPYFIFGGGSNPTGGFGPRAGTEVVTVLQDATSSPAFCVQQGGNSISQPSTFAQPLILVGGKTITASNALALLAFGYYEGGVSTNPPAVFGYKVTTSGGTTCGAFVWGVRNVTTDTISTEAMRLTSDAKLLIGATSSDSSGALLQVAGNGISLAAGGGIYNSSATKAIQLVNGIVLLQADNADGTQSNYVELSTTNTITQPSAEMVALQNNGSTKGWFNKDGYYSLATPHPIGVGSTTGSSGSVGKRIGTLTINNTSDTTFTATAMSTPTLSGTGTAASAPAADSAMNMISYTTDGTNNGVAGLAGPFTITRFDYRVRFSAVVRTDSAVTSRRIYVGLSNADLSGNATLAGMNGNRAVVFRYDTGLSDTNWMAVSSDGTTASATSTGLAVAANKTYRLVIDFFTSGKMLFKVEDITGGTLGSGGIVNKTSNAPTGTTDIGLQATNTALTAAAQVIYIGKVAVEQN